MEIVQWLNENALRAYPLIEGKTVEQIPDGVILDLLLNISEGTDPATAKLTALVVNSTDITVIFTDNFFDYNYAEHGVSGIDNITFPIYIRNASGSLVVLGEDLKKITRGTVFNVDVPVEPATVYQFSGAWNGVTSISGNPNYLSGGFQIANIMNYSGQPSVGYNTVSVGLGNPGWGPQIQANPHSYEIVFNGGLTADIATASGSPYPGGRWTFTGEWPANSNGAPLTIRSKNTDSFAPFLPLQSVDGVGLTGDIEFVPGYNYAINFNNNAINMTVGYRLGLKMDCTTKFLQDKYLDCGDIVSYINGVPPDDSGVFKFTAGSNIYLFDGDSVQEPIQDTNLTPPLSVYTDISGDKQTGLNNNTIFVGLTFLESDLCSPIQLLPTNN
jgi:hypothetical protein